MLVCVCMSVSVHKYMSVYIQISLNVHIHTCIRINSAHSSIGCFFFMTSGVVHKYMGKRVWIGKSLRLNSKNNL